MSNTYCMSSAPSVRLLHITDSHLFADEQGTLLGINTQRSFNAVLQAINASHFAYDIILATGDFVQEQNQQAYHRFAQTVAPLAKPLFWVEGNHDSQPQMGEMLANYPQIYPQKHLLLGEYWQLILLDSHLAGKPCGSLSHEQLQFLQQKLTAYPKRYSLVVLHHNILPTGSAWLDQHSLANAEQLAAVLKPFPNVKAIIHGHIHQEVDSVWHQWRVLATPSTCIQFKPNCTQFTLDTCPQGWRELILHPSGEIETVVKRLENNAFLPDFSANGY